MGPGSFFCAKKQLCNFYILIGGKIGAYWDQLIERENYRMLDEVERAEVVQLIEKALLDHDQKFKQLYPIIEKLDEEYKKQRHPLE